MSEEEKAAVLRSCETFVSQMSAAGIRCHGDMRDNYTAGWKFNCWELKVSVQSYMFSFIKNTVCALFH